MTIEELRGWLELVRDAGALGVLAWALYLMRGLFRHRNGGGRS